MHFTCFWGSPDSQLARWLMIVSIAIAVFPVWRSPMMSSRCPRPIAVIASMALMPVWRGSFTGWRCTTDGAWISSARVSSASMSPLPSMGRPSASTTRPRNPSPTGTERMRPVWRTSSPSSIFDASPRITHPISRTSRLNAIPRMPPGNSSSSFASVPGSPSTRATPSPVSVTWPISSRVTPCSNDWTCFRRAAAISSGSIGSSATISLPSRAQPASCSIASSSLRRTLPSMTSSPTRASTPPRTEGSTMTSRSTLRSKVLARASASRSRRSSSMGTAVRASTTTRFLLAAARSASSSIRSTGSPTLRSASCIRRSVASEARPARRSSTSACLFWSGRTGSLSALRSRGSVSRSRANLNSSSSTSGSDPSCCAWASVAWTARSSRTAGRRHASASSRASATSSSRVCRSTRLESRSPRMSSRAWAGTPTSARALRRVACERRRSASANSSSRTPASPSASAARAKASSARSRASRRYRRSARATLTPPGAAVAVRPLRGKLLDVSVHQLHLPVPVERAAHDALRDLHGQRPDLAAQLLGRPGPLRLDLLAGALDDPLRFRLGPGHEVPANLLRPLAGLVQDAGPLRPGLGQLPATLLDQLLGFLPRRLRLLQVGLDAVGPLVHGLAQPPPHARAPQDRDEQDERDGSPDELVRCGQDQLRAAVRDHVCRTEHVLPLAGDEEAHEPDQGEHVRERDAQDHGGLESGGHLRLAGLALHGLADHDADPDAGTDGGEAVPDHADASLDRREDAQDGAHHARFVHLPSPFSVAS